MSDWKHRETTVTRGHRVASGLGGDPRFPVGTIAPQLPFFRRKISDFDSYLGEVHAGTLNLSVAPAAVVLQAPEIRLVGIRWSPLMPAETFLLSHAALEHHGRRYPAFLYMPDPATKVEHHQPASIIEVLAPTVAGIGYGSAITLFYNARAIRIADLPH